MDMQGTRALSATQQQAWDALNNPEILKTCIAGCEKFEATGDNQFTSTVAVKIGPVAEDDIGKVIGKDGRTAQAIRTVLSAASAKSGRRVQLDIVDLPRLFVTSRDDVPSCEADPARRGRTPPRRAR